MFKDILRDMTGKVVNVMKDHVYRFDEDYKSRAQRLYDEYLLSLPVDTKITHEINHTKFPDEIVLMILECQGAYFKNIHELSSVEAINITDPDRYGYVFKITLVEPKVRTIVDVEFNNEIIDEIKLNN